MESSPGVDEEADPAALKASKLKQLKRNDQESLDNALKDTNVIASDI